MQPTSDYPVHFAIDYQEGPRDRLSIGLRFFFAIPILILVAAVGGESFQFGGGDAARFSFATAGGVLFLGPLLMIVFRQKYPRWWFDWNLAFLRFTTRVVAYVALLRDEYPSTDEDQAVHIDIPYPDVPNELNRWLPLVKWLLAIPHFIVLIVLGIAAFVVTVVAWFAILFTGQHPRGLSDFVQGVIRWGTRVEAYALLLTTDRYPPFSLE
ncbi:MAG: DUF4389 domain-containing protein [Dehalococcoidia bacterium]|nr:DUF4389 domain-containing protein [Dehalococcoidia bacterium]